MGESRIDVPASSRPMLCEQKLPITVPNVPDMNMQTPVCTENLNPGIAVMESAEDGERFDASGPLNRARDRCILSNDRCVLMSLYNTTTERPRDRGVRASLSVASLGRMPGPYS